jgi:hypothetical protein
MKINNYLFGFEKIFKNNNSIDIVMNFHSWGLGLNFSISDSRIWFDFDFLCWHFSSRIMIKDYYINDYIKGYDFSQK